MNSSQQERRFVVYIGPAKTASTTLQQWLGRRVNSQTKAFSNWTYPLVGGKRNYIFALFKGKESQKRSIRKKFSSLAHSQKSVIVASEALAKEDLGMPNELHKWMDFQSAPPEIVIHYRSPRKSHLVSLWKQSTQAGVKVSRGLSFRDWMCDSSDSATDRRILDIERRLNPLGLASAFVDHSGRYRLKTYLVDMSGVQHAGMDICHAFSCQVLRVDCTSSYLKSDHDEANGSHMATYGQQWVKGLEGDVYKEMNRKSGDPELSEYQLAALDEVLTQRDCAYYKDLVNNSLLTVLYRHNLWSDDCSDVLDNAEAYNDGLLWRNNVTALLERMRQIVGCSASDSNLAFEDPSNLLFQTTEAPQNYSKVDMKTATSMSLDSAFAADMRHLTAVVWATVVLVLLTAAGRRLKRVCLSNGAELGAS